MLSVVWRIKSKLINGDNRFSASLPLIILYFLNFVPFKMPSSSCLRSLVVSVLWFTSPDCLMAGFLSSVPTVPVYSMALICLLSFVSMRAGHLGAQQIFIK